MRRISREQRGAIQQWLLDHDHQLHAGRVPLTMLGLLCNACVGFTVSNQSVRRVLWRLRLHGRMKYYSGKSDAVYCLKGGKL